MLVERDDVGAFVPYAAVPVPSAAGGPLAGLAFAVKDLFDVAGYPTGCGSPLKQAESPIAAASAPVVQRMLDAGARFLGKTNTDELAFSLNGQNIHTGSPVNPRAPGRITGGSSSGSAAAVAAGLCDFAIGSDTGGSIRAPASYCGLFGIRPSHGRVPLDAVMPLAPSFDTPGYFADSGAVFAKVAPVFLGEDPKPFRLQRLLRAEDAFALLLSGAEAEALAPAEAKVAARLGPAEGVIVATEGLERWYWVFRHLQAWEAWQSHGAWIEDRDPVMTPGVRERFEFGRSVTPAQKAEAESARAAIRRRLDALLGEDAVLMLPSAPSIAPESGLSGEGLQAFRERALCILAIAGLSGLPQVSIPLAGMDGCPLGLSLLGPRGSDRALVELAVGIAAG
ncbi:amidase [Propylenella binzhouense]|uniref:Amidase n=1 Tax=Propylenella binzhouense TaxID=2555902 RepID=A0A964T4L8_9HYPH|nr:amidase [Propylenella binzhouense]MYZ48249.1 amidase [Propylenella binzhouense]